MSGRREGSGRRLSDDGLRWTAPPLEGMRLPSEGIGALMAMSFGTGALVALLVIFCVCGKL